MVKHQAFHLIEVLHTKIYHTELSDAESGGLGETLVPDLVDSIDYIEYNNNLAMEIPKKFVPLHIRHPKTSSRRITGMSQSYIVQVRMIHDTEKRVDEIQRKMNALTNMMRTIETEIKALTEDFQTAVKSMEVTSLHTGQLYRTEEGTMRVVQEAQLQPASNSAPVSQQLKLPEVVIVDD